ncbi:MAG: hypothetical protein ACP5NS_02315 [Candidatus Pacearchaeota archaeon]
MGILEDVASMQQAGTDEQTIISKLQEQGMSYRDISDALAQSKIKAAVDGQYNNTPYENNQQSTFEGQNPGLQPSIMQAPQASPEGGQEYFPSYDASAGQQQGQSGGNYDYSQGGGGGYDYTSSSVSSDTITEISEQIVSEKLSDVRRKMEKIISSKTELDAKTEAIEERLKRIEKIIDTLQTSVLRKVGDYVTNVEDIKKELIETQKTMGKVMGTHHSKK